MNFMLYLTRQFHVVRLSMLIFCVLFRFNTTLISAAESVEPDAMVLEQETRTYRAFVDGRERGQLVTQFTKRSNGTETVRGEAELNFNFVVYRYRYTSIGTETWKDGRLVRLASESNYNGDKYVLQATATDEMLEYEVNGEAQRAATDALITTHWREPSVHKVGRKLTVLDSDKGQQRFGTLEKVGTEKTMIAGDEINATHYRIRGDVEVDVWYDEARRLVRQDSMESGHRMILVLSKTQR
jgi:hypothetical protein